MPADYSGVYPYIRIRLQDSIADAVNSDFDIEIGAVVRRLLAPYPGHTYATLSIDDGLTMDEAVGLLVSARLITPYSTGGAASDLSGIKSASGSQMTFTGAGPTQKEIWVKEAMRAFSRLSFAISPFVFSYFALGGRRRSEDQPVQNIYDLAFGENDGTN